MARSRGSFQGRGRSRPTGRTWDIGPGSTGINGGSIDITGNGSILGSGVSPTTDKLTIMRTRGELLITADIDAITEGAHLAVGLGIVTADAFAVGRTAVPSPIADEGWDGWYWHSYVMIGGAVNTTDVVGSAQLGSSIWRVEIDSKAMRKIDTDEIAFFAIGMADLEGTTQVICRCRTRMLVQQAST